MSVGAAAGARISEPVAELVRTATPALAATGAPARRATMALEKP
jgi:hypothetical protein